MLITTKAANIELGYLCIMKAYFISGLAADKRVFKFIKLPAGYEAVFLDWIEPKRNESLHSYSLRMAERINKNEPFVLVGLSMGGMISCEIAANYSVEKVILISSVPSHKELPSYFRILYKLKIHRIIPGSLFKSASIIKRIFTVEPPEVKQMLRQIIRDSDPEFIRWAIGAIMEWKGEKPGCPVYHIHGSTDEILPVSYTHPDYCINKGTHLMVMTRADEINSVLKNVLAENIKAL